MINTPVNVPELVREGWPKYLAYLYETRKSIEAQIRIAETHLGLRPVVTEGCCTICGKYNDTLVGERCGECTVRLIYGTPKA